MQFQSIPKSAVRPVANVLRFSNISAYMKDTLHWLLVDERIKLDSTLLWLGPGICTTVHCLSISEAELMYINILFSLILPKGRDVIWGGHSPP